MPAFTITAVSPQVRDWTASQGGAMRGYRVNVKDAQGVETQNVEWSKKATSDPPRVGEQVDANLDTSGQYGPKLKVIFANKGGFGGGGGRPKDPAERAAIAASVALREGREAVEQAVTMGLEKPESLDAHKRLWERYANFAYAFIDSKSKAAA